MKDTGVVMKDIEILPDQVSVPQVTLQGDDKMAAEERNITTVHVSLSHSEVSHCLYLLSILY